MNAYIITLLQNRAYYTMQTIFARIIAAYIIIGSILSMFEFITIQEHVILLTISAATMVGLFIVDLVRKAFIE